MLKKVVIPLVVLFLALLVGGFWFRKTPERAENKEATDKETIDIEQLKTQIGQMLMIGFRGTEVKDNSYITKAIQDLGVGGVMLFDVDVPSNSFPRNILNPQQTKNLIADLQKYAEIPLFVAVDAEGGLINRLKEKYGFIAVPSHKELGQNEATWETKAQSYKLAQQLKELGFNMNFAPVVDVDVNPDNPVIGKLERSFSTDPQKVAEFAAAFIESHYENNVIPVVKHFPGHGSSKEDSHLGLVDVTLTYQEDELIPYKKLQEQGLLQALMTAHIINKNIDEDYPATLSERFLQDILKEEIGFEGVVISDDMQMGAILNHYGLEEAIIRAINAGCDIIVFSNNSKTNYDETLPYRVKDIILDAVKEGKISTTRIAEAASRIAVLKRSFLNGTLR